MNKGSLMIAMGFAISSSGCAKLASNYTPEPVMVNNTASKPYITDGGQIDLNGVPFKDSEQLEDFVVSSIGASDLRCEEHKAQIIANTQSWNVGAGSATILLAGAASIVGHAGTASDLAAAAAAVTGIQALVNKEVYSNSLGTTILSAIDRARVKTKSPLEQGLEDLNNYSYSKAILDIQSYHSSCSLMAGLIEINKAFENQRPTREQLEKRVKTLDTEIKALDTKIGSVRAEDTALKSQYQTLKAQYELQKQRLILDQTSNFID